MKTALFNPPQDLEQHYLQTYQNMGLVAGHRYLILGDIENMPGHIAVATRDGRVLWGFHPDWFDIDTDE